MLGVSVVQLEMWWACTHGELRVYLGRKAFSALGIHSHGAFVPRLVTWVPES